MVDESALKNIEKLHEMKGAGILSEAEFDEAKRKLLSGATGAQSPAVSTVAPLERPAADDYVGWVLLPLRRYAQFEGRSSRKEFWLFFLAVSVGLAVLVNVWTSDTYYDGTGVIGTFAALAAVLALVGITVPYFALQVRRLHDLGKPGSLALFNLIPFLGPFIVLALMAIEGVRGANTYGPDPLA